MKKILLFITPFLFICIAQTQATDTVSRTNQSVDISVMTFNIRYDNPGDGVNTWKERKEKAAQTILTYKADIIGIQEALYNQIMDLEESLNDYKWIGVGREDGKQSGEYVPIFYNSKKFTAIESGYFWLSENPSVPSLGWDAVCRRVATWAKLKDNRNGKTIFVLNTHFDHIGEVARAESVELILKAVEEHTKNTSCPIIVTGDFNADPNSSVVKGLTDSNKHYSLTDSYTVALKKYGPEQTFQGFGHTPIEEQSRIDYIFVKNDISVLEYRVIDDRRGEQYISDHYPILVKASY